MSISSAPPYTRGPAERLTLDLPADISRALTAWIAAQPEPKPDRRYQDGEAPAHRK